MGDGIACKEQYMNEWINQYILSAFHDGNHYLIVFNIVGQEAVIVPYKVVPDNDDDRSAKGLAPVVETTFIRGIVWLDTRKTMDRGYARFMWRQLTEVQGFRATTTQELFQGKNYHIIKSAPEQSAPVRMSYNHSSEKISTSYALEA